MRRRHANDPWPRFFRAHSKLLATTPIRSPSPTRRLPFSGEWSSPSPIDLPKRPSNHLRTMSNPAQSFDSPRRSVMFGRQPEELHIPSTGLTNPNLSRQLSSHDYPTTPDAGASLVPSINVHSSNSQPMQYASASGSNTSALPGALTPGNQNRPPAVSVNTAPSVLPTLPQSSTQQTSHRSSMINSHGHSRSSPPGFERSMYTQHSAPEGSKYPGSPGTGFPPHTPQGSKYSPLGLADIRLPPDHLLGDALMSPGGLLPYNGDNQVPTNSNYIAPWPIYAVDWCKWPISGSSSSHGGKLALGTYLEDNHNYVGACISSGDFHMLTGCLDPNRRHTLVPAGSRYSRRRGRGDQARIRQDSRGDTLLSRHAHSLGTTVVAKTVHRSARHVGGSPPLVVTPQFSTPAELKLHHTTREPT